MNMRFIINSNKGFLIPMIAVISLMFVTCEMKFIGVALLTIGVAFTYDYNSLIAEYKLKINLFFKVVALMVLVFL